MTYTKVAFTKLYDCKTTLLATDLLDDRVALSFDEHGVSAQPDSDRPRRLRSTAAP
jgi:hypothetical protein